MSHQYQSSHGATRPLTAAQKLAEMACERIASRDGKTLPARFWAETSWAATYAAQVRFACRLLKIYDPQVVFRAFRRANRIWSLGAPFLVEQLEREDRTRQINARVAEEVATSPPLETGNTAAIPRARVQGSRSPRAKLSQLNAKESKDAGQKPPVS